MNNFTPKKILISRTDHLGDLLLTTPLFEAVKTKWPKAFLGVLVRPELREVVEGNPFVDKVEVFSGDFSELTRHLRTEAYDASVVVYPRWPIALACWRAGVAHRIGTAYRWYSWCFNERVSIHRKTSGRHEMELNFDLVIPLGVTYANEPLRIPLRPEDENTADRLLSEAGIRAQEPILAVHPGSRGSAGNWNAGQYAKCMAALIKEGRQVVVTGNSPEGASIQAALSALRGTYPAVLCGKTSIRELAAILKRCAVLVSGSTGPMHVAAAVGCPTVSLFPHDEAMSPHRWGPWGNRAEIVQPRAEEGSVANIPVDRVIQAVRKMLQ